MPRPTSLRPRLRAAGRWLLPSVAAACAGATATGVAEVALGGPAGAPGPAALTAAATVGFASVAAVPALLAASVVLRGVWAAWQPRALVAALTDEGGGAPRLAAWLLYAHLAVAFLGWASLHGTWVISVWTTFKPGVVGLLELACTGLAALGALALSRPTARLLAWLLGRLDARRRRRGRPSRLTPRAIVAALVALDVAGAAALWRWVVAPRLGPFDAGPALAPAAGVAVALLAHAGARPAARVRAALAGAITAAALAAALAVRVTSPAATLAIWGERPLAGMAVDWLFDLDAVHADFTARDVRPAARPGAAHRDIILITIDTTRADRTPPYGGPADMPTLRELGQRGVVFDWAFAPSNVTRRSIPSMVIGAAPDRVRGRVVGWALRVDPRHVFVAERLAAGGYETAGFMCCTGFWDPRARTGLGRGLQHLEVETTNDGAKIAAGARAWLEAREARRPGRPLFVWMHLLEPHNWLLAHADARTDRERRAGYDATLAGVDRMIATALAPFAARPPEAQPIVIVTADHGEALGDHGQPFHSTDLYNSQLRVPLVVAGPGLAPRRVAETVSLTDLAPTLLDLAGFAPPSGPGLDGASFAPLATGARPSAAGGGVAYAAMIKDRSNPGGVTAVVRGRHKLIDREGVLELYDVWADPDERANLIATQPAVAEELRRLLAELRARGRRSPFAAP